MAVFALSCFGLLLFLWLSFGGPIPLKPKGYRFQVAFAEATQLAEQADVRIAGVSVGKVVGKVRDPRGNRTLATIELERAYAPLHTDAKAILRQKTLLGETYVEMTPGTRRAPELKEDGHLADGRVGKTVEIDEFLSMFPKRTREDFRRWQANGAETIKGRDRDFNDALGNLGPFAQDGANLLEVLDRRRTALGALVRETGVVFEAFTRDEDALRAFLGDTSRWFQATASEREQLAAAMRVFPTFLDESKATLARLQTFAVETDPLIKDLRPVARDLKPTLRDLKTMSPDLRKLFTDLPPLIRASETGMPALSDVLKALEPTFAATGPFLSQVNPLLQWLEVNNAKVSEFLSAGPAALGGRRATNQPGGNGHALPQLIMMGSQSLITPQRTKDNRGNAYMRQDGLAPDPRYKQGYYVWPVWDCKNAGGEKKADGDPGCYVQGPFDFQGRQTRYPRVSESMPK
jgi:virulence factor Mce-like protein